MIFHGRSVGGNIRLSTNRRLSFFDKTIFFNLLGYFFEVVGNEIIKNRRSDMKKSCEKNTPSLNFVCVPRLMMDHGLEIGSFVVY
jgi:hypothetical protein